MTRVGTSSVSAADAAAMVRQVFPQRVLGRIVTGDGPKWVSVYGSIGRHDELPCVVLSGRVVRGTVHALKPGFAPGAGEAS